MTVVLQPVVTAEKLQELLAEQTESEFLDFKRTADLKRTRDVVEIVKDIGAMQIDGGFLVIGADDHGVPTGELAEREWSEFDEARLRGKALKYLPDSVSLMCGRHDLGGSKLVLIYVAPNPDAFAVFKADGNYPGGSAFRCGEVYARHGSASEPWTQADIAKVRRRMVATEKAAWLSERALEMETLLRNYAGQQLAQAPAAALRWDLDEESFVSTVVEQLRGGDTYPLKLFLDRVPEDASRLAQRPHGLDDLNLVLDRLTSLTPTLITLDEDMWFRRVVDCLVAIYDIGFDERGQPRSMAVHPARLWLMVVERAVAIGAVAVRKERWDLVRYVALRRGRGTVFTDPVHHYVSWIRHAVTMAARSDLLTSAVDGQEKDVSLLSLALSHAQRMECLRGGLTPADEGLVDSICQFDALAMADAINEDGRIDASVYYPSFGRFYEHRTQPMLARLIRDPVLREAICPDAKDEDLAQALHWMTSTAIKESWRFAGWDSVLDPTLRQFLESHPEA